jgi:hypothetical protein
LLLPDQVRVSDQPRGKYRYLSVNTVEQKSMFAQQKSLPSGAGDLLDTLIRIAPSTRRPAFETFFPIRKASHAYASGVVPWSLPGEHHDWPS